MKGRGKSKREGAPIRFAPIKTRMSEENGDATNEQAKKAQRIDPMSDADDSKVARKIQNV